VTSGIADSSARNAIRAGSSSSTIMIRIGSVRCAHEVISVSTGIVRDTRYRPFGSFSRDGRPLTERGGQPAPDVFQPSPVPRRRESGSYGFETTTNSRGPVMTASTRISPPSISVATPWRTAFSRAAAGSWRHADAGRVAATSMTAVSRVPEPDALDAKILLDQRRFA
jgi:hypothetical protein